MSDKPKRTLEQIQQDYNNVAFRAGNLQYVIAAQKTDLDQLNIAMRDLSIELFNASKAAEAEKAAEAKPAQG